MLALIDKGVGAADTARAVERLADAGIAVEAMAFTGFPTETTAEALQTVRFLDEHRPSLALFICGEFALTSGSRVALEPGRFGVDDVGRVGQAGGGVGRRARA